MPLARVWNFLVWLGAQSEPVSLVPRSGTQPTRR
jgi:hypothetical protein